MDGRVGRQESGLTGCAEPPPAVDAGGGPGAGQPLLLGLAQQLGLTGHGECYAAAHLAELGRRLGCNALATPTPTNCSRGPRKIHYGDYL
jgi:hypothetical protein